MSKSPVAIYSLLVLLQVVLSHLFQTGPLLVLTLLPVMVLGLPAEWSTLHCMSVAFFSGLAVDLMADGLVGLNAFALLPVAYIRRFLMKKAFSEELVERGERLSWKKWGWRPFLLCTLLNTALFLLLYITVDAAGTRSILFSLEAFGLSLAVNLVLAVPVLALYLEK